MFVYSCVCLGALVLFFSNVLVYVCLHIYCVSMCVFNSTSLAIILPCVALEFCVCFSSVSVYVFVFL